MSRETEQLSYVGRRGGAGVEGMLCYRKRNRETCEDHTPRQAPPRGRDFTGRQHSAFSSPSILLPTTVGLQHSSHGLEPQDPEVEMKNKTWVTTTRHRLYIAKSRDDKQEP